MRSSLYDFVPNIAMRVSPIHEPPSHKLEGGGDLRAPSNDGMPTTVYISSRAAFLD